MGEEKCQKRVLVVEDNELNRKIAAQVIEDEGILTECASDGLEAVRKIKEAPEYYFDLILMDVQMPGLNGYQAAEQIRGLGRHDTDTVPILAMTAYTFPEDLMKAEQSGMSGYIAKPLDMDVLYEKLEQWLVKM